MNIKHKAILATLIMLAIGFAYWIQDMGTYTPPTNPPLWARIFITFVLAWGIIWIGIMPWYISRLKK